MQFQLITFGELSLHDCATRRTRSLQRKALTLLAVLAAAGRSGMSRERLVALLWPESSEEAGRGALKQTMYELRRALGNGDVATGGPDLALDPSVIGSDVADLQAAYAAKNWKLVVEIYHGPFLDGVSVRHSAEFERWADAQRPGYEKIFRDALEHLAIQAAVAGDSHGAMEWWRTYAAADPFCARAAVGLMGALAAFGDTTGALAHYRVHKTLLRDELESEPDATVVEAAARIRETCSGNVERSTASAALDCTSHLTSSGTAGPLAAAAPGEGPTEEAVPSSDGGFASAALPPVRRASRRIRAARAAAFGVAVAAIASVVAVTTNATGTPTTLPILVMPFQNTSEDGTLDAVGVMAADWITENVIRAHLAPVIGPAYTGATQADGPGDGDGTAHESARAARAGVLVTGRVYGLADSLRYYALVTDVRTGRALAAFGPLTHPRTQQAEALAEVADRVVGALARIYDRRLSDVMDSLQSPPRAEAYQAYIRGLVLFARERKYDAALAEFRAAYTLDTTFITAQVWTAWSLRMLRRHTDVQLLIDSLDQRRSALSPLHQHAVDAFKAVYAADGDGAIAAASRAAAIAPQSEWAWNRAYWTLMANRPREARRLLESVDPSSGWMRNWGSRYWVGLGTAHHLTGDFAGELKALRRAPGDAEIDLELAAALHHAATGRYSEVHRYVGAIVQVDTFVVARKIRWAVMEMLAHDPLVRTLTGKTPVDSILRVYRSWLSRQPHPRPIPLRFIHASLMYHVGDLPEAKRELSSLVGEQPGNLVFAGSLARILAREGDSTRARALLAEFPHPERRLLQDQSVRVWQAMVEGWLGNRAEATALLAAAFREGYVRIDGPHTFTAEFPKLRGYRPFEELVRSR